VPEHCIEEIEKHIVEITKRSGLTAENAYLLLGIFWLLFRLFHGKEEHSFSLQTNLKRFAKS
jgi:hypothetical protein